MTALHVKYLVAGGGAAGTAAAKAIRSEDPAGSVLVVGQEVHRAYRRPELSRGYLRKQLSREQLYLDDPRWFAEHRVDLRTGRTVARLDPPRSAAVLDDGREVSYDHLLIATGASPAPLAVPGADLPNLFALRAMADADALRKAVETAHRGGRPHGPPLSAAGGRGSDGDGDEHAPALPAGRGKAVVIGGGLLGVEVAASLRHLGLAVDLVCGGPHPWSHQAGEATGRFVMAALARAGVTVHAGRRAIRLEGDGRVQRVVLDDAAGSALDCDLAVACVGARANKDLTRHTTIAAGRAILADAAGRTSVPNVYAAGDCAAVLDPRFGKHRWLAHWDGALATADHAGRNMARHGTGRPAEPFAALPAWDTEVFGLTARGWGEARLVDRRIIRGTPNGQAAGDGHPGFAEIGVATDGRVAQVIVVGQVAEADALMRLVADRADVTGREDAVRDPTVRLA